MGVSLVAQRYRLDEKIGAGGMGVVWLATDLELGRVVALAGGLVGRRGRGRQGHPREATFAGWECDWLLGPREVHLSRIR